jgi:ankyrin repeat protein
MQHPDDKTRRMSDHERREKISQAIGGDDDWIAEIFLMNRLPELGQVNSYGTALHDAAHLGSAKAIRRLLDAGIDISAVDENGNTALHICCARGNEECQELLLQAGADPLIRNKHGLTCSDLSEGHEDENDPDS